MSSSTGGFLATSRAAGVSGRMGPDLRTAIELHPGLAGLALWVRFSDTEESDFIAATDGKTIYAGPAYLERPPKERLFILLHELLHVALAHPSRMRELAKRQPDFDPQAYNIAADALINASLEHGINLTAPKDAVKLPALLTMLGLWPERGKVEEEVRKWSSEALYRAIMKQSNRVFYSGNRVCLEPGSPGKSFVMDIQTNQQTQNQTSLQAEGQIRDWARRLQLARGVLPGMLERLAGELPEVKTPWEKLLRNYLYRRLSIKKVTDYARPSRRWLGLEYEMHQHEGVALPFEPDRTRPGPAGRIAVVVDSSGSIDDPVLLRFGSEVAQIMARTSSQVLLIICDAAVHQIEELVGFKGQERLRKLHYKGRGGTDFRPAINAASGWRPDVLVYLTDLEGPAGEAPTFPVVWAIPPGLPQRVAPWGNLIELD